MLAGGFRDFYNALPGHFRPLNRFPEIKLAKNPPDKICPKSFNHWAFSGQGFLQYFQVSGFLSDIFQVPTDEPVLTKSNDASYVVHATCAFLIFDSSKHWCDNRIVLISFQSFSARRSALLNNSTLNTCEISDRDSIKLI
jgi:hypothetical protein